MNSDFHQIIKDWRQMPFVWGANDCCTGAAWVYERLYGKDFAAEFRGYTSALGAYRMLKKHGGMDGIMKKLNFVEVPVMFGHRGDVVVYKQERFGETMGILTDSNAVFAGNQLVHRRFLQKAYRIGTK